MTLLNMPVKLATKVQAKTAKICRGWQLKKLIAVNDDINHKKMKPGAMTISTKRQMKSQLEASAAEDDARREIAYPNVYSALK